MRFLTGISIFIWSGLWWRSEKTEKRGSEEDVMYSLHDLSAQALNAQKKLRNFHWAGKTPPAACWSTSQGGPVLPVPDLFQYFLCYS